MMTTDATIESQMAEAFYEAKHHLGRPPVLCELGPKRWRQWERHLAGPPFHCAHAAPGMTFNGMAVRPMAEAGVRVS